MKVIEIGDNLNKWEIFVFYPFVFDLKDKKGKNKYINIFNEYVNAFQNNESKIIELGNNICLKLLNRDEFEKKEYHRWWLPEVKQAFGLGENVKNKKDRSKESENPYQVYLMFEGYKDIEQKNKNILENYKIFIGDDEKNKELENPFLSSVEYIFFMSKIGVGIQIFHIIFNWKEQLKIEDILDINYQFRYAKKYGRLMFFGKNSECYLLNELSEKLEEKILKNLNLEGLIKFLDFTPPLLIYLLFEKEIEEKLKIRFSRFLPSNEGIEELELEKDLSINSFKPNSHHSVYASIEGLTVVGIKKTSFAENFINYVRKNYFMTFVLSLHQAILFQELSRRSFFQVNRGKSKEVESLFMELYRDFTIITTLYEYGLISYHINYSKLYEILRKAFNIEEQREEVRDELQTWIEMTDREEMKFLNSIAILVVIFSISTLFINLNLIEFSKDAAVSIFEFPKSLFFLIPLIICLLFLLKFKNLFKIVVDYLKRL